VNETGGRDGVLVLYRLFSLPIVLATAAACFAGSAGAVAGLAAGAVYGVWSWRARKKAGGAVLQVEGDVVRVAIRGRRIIRDIRLGDLDDVTLDVKTIERVMDGSSVLPAVRLIDSQVAPKVDTARIVLVDTEGQELRLTDEYLPYSDATDSLGRIRLFLRKHGWVPEDEREIAGADADDSDAEE
jgi:hypothetical protein